MNKAQCNSLTRTRFEKFANVRHYTETNAFPISVCRVKNCINVQNFVQIETFVNTNVIVCIKVSSFVHVAIKMCICESGDTRAFIHISSESILFDSF